MTSLNNFDEITDRVLQDLKDKDANFWSRDEVFEYIHEAQLQYCEDTDYLRQESTIISKENREVYNYPEDIIKLFRAENSEGKKLELVDSEFLQKKFGNGFRTDTGTAQCLYSDLDGEGQFRLFPRPSPSIEDGGNEITQSFLQPISIHDDGTIVTPAKIVYNGELIVLRSSTIDWFDESYNIVRSVTHGISLGTTPSITVVRGLNAQVSNPTENSGVIFFSTGESSSKIYRVGLDGAVSLFASTTVTILHLLPILAGNFITYTSSGSIYSSPLSSWSETNEISGTIRDFSFNEKVILVTSSTAGLIQITESFGSLSVGLSTVSVANSPNILGICSSRGTFYANYQGTLYSVDISNLSSFVFTATSVATLINNSTSGHIQAGDNYIWTQTGTDDEILKIDITDFSIEATYTHVTDDGHSILVYSRDFHNNLITGSQNVDGYGQQLYTTDNEIGGVVYVDGDTFDQEEGVVIDSIDPDQTVVFDGEFGAVVSIFESATSLILFYSREPKEGVIEVSDTRAIIEYVKYLCLEKTGDRKGLPKANYFLNKYEKRRKYQQSKSARGHNNNPRGTTPVYF